MSGKKKKIKIDQEKTMKELIDMYYKKNNITTDKNKYYFIFNGTKFNYSSDKNNKKIKEYNQNDNNLVHIYVFQ